MSKAIAIIPARGGSKRIPRKNIKDFFGKPLLAYSIEVALASNLFDKVVVSTDDEEIASIAKSYGAEVPFLRPKELSDDFTGTADVANHTIEYLASIGEYYEFACTIYATAPLLQKEYLIEGYEKLKNSDAINAFSVTSMPFPIQRTFRVDEGGRCEMFTPEHYMSRSQDLEEAYQDAGQFYWTKVGKKSDEIMFGKNSIPIILPRHLVQDIDTMEDWVKAELMYKVLHPNTFDRWNVLKQKLQEREELIRFKGMEIYFMSVGQNIGQEVYGKSNQFLRPVLIYKKLNYRTFVGIPLTSAKKEGSYYFSFQYKRDKQSTALFSQIRVFDIKRTVYYSGKIKRSDYQKLKSKLFSFLDITPNSEKRRIGTSSRHSRRWQKNLPKEIAEIIAKDGTNVK